MSTLPSLPEHISFSNTLPKTIQGIKKRAKKIGMPGQKHTEALDTVAREMGYRDYRQALHTLASSEGFLETNQTGCPVFLCAYWRDTNTTPR